MGFGALFDEQNRDVGQKLGLATGLMFTLPILVYYLCFHFVFAHKAEPSNWAGGAAIFTTNVIVFGYVLVAFTEPEDPKEKARYGQEDSDNDNDNDNEHDTGHDNDAHHPRVGIFKKRTD